MRSRQGEEENLNLRGSNGRENLKGETGFQGFIQRGFPALGNCVEIDIPMLLLIVGLSQSTGAYKAASRLAIATPPPAYVLS
ncbi:nucleobase-ascorbate transporter 1-like isoform X4 [Vigna radiata var. radiata]|uniref:Nucleobase-ascorbate transporter 1-like isoform X4 n=1 Tax=Vigna radiata var. radiata TaxID=3916 RepID=A0A3Q0FHB8_VIGRR|nr:nucleobase-ascorbate transporter 1-like isoform X4 [Vigna radiata var. radiata]